MKIVYFGSAGIGIPSLQALVASEHSVIHIFTQPARQAGRKKKLKPTAVSIWAQENSIPCSEAADINSSEMIEKIAACKADLLVVIAFGQKISQRIIKLHPKAAINVHASVLPKYRGAAPINLAIINGDTQTGVTIITLADKMDAGEMLAKARTDITPDDNAETLTDKLAQLAPGILIETIDHIASGTVVYTKQDESQVTLARKLKKSDAFIDWAADAESIRNKIRGQYPWPGAQADFVSAKTQKCCRVNITQAQVVQEKSGPGSLGKLNENLNVICGKDALRIVKLKPAGGKIMDFKAFVNGRAVAPGDVFISIDKNE